MKIYDLLLLRKMFVPQMGKSLPASLAYKLFHVIRRGENEEKFYLDRLNKIIEKYAERDEKGKIISNKDAVKMDESQKEAWQVEINELQNIPVDFEIEFTLSELSPLEFTVAEMSVLSNYIVEENENNDTNHQRTANRRFAGKHV